MGTVTRPRKETPPGPAKGSASPRLAEAGDSSISSGIKAAWIMGGCAVLAALIGAGASTAWFGATSSRGNPGVASGGTVSRWVTNQAARHTNATEYADNRNGSPVFADPLGEPWGGPGGTRIPFNSQVSVACYSPSQAGMASVTGFYLISAGPWKGAWVVSDTMSNGGSPGNTDAPNVDPRVPSCT